MIKLNNISKIYHKNEKAVYALNNINLEINENKFIVVKGPSGSGKTTLLLTLGGMLKPDSGDYIFNDFNIYQNSQKLISNFRNEKISFIFQTFHLIPFLNIYENILLGKPKHKSNTAKDEIKNILKLLDLDHRIDHKPEELSTGECQRVAVGRAIFSGKKLLLADEPTGNLDPENEKKVLESFLHFHKKGGTVVIVTHGNFGEKYADQVIQLQNGQITPV